MLKTFNLEKYITPFLLPGKVIVYKCVHIVLFPILNFTNQV